MRSYLGLGVQCSILGLILRLYHVSCWQKCLIDGIFRQKTCPASHMKNSYISKSFGIVTDIPVDCLHAILLVHAYQECTLYLHQNNLEKMYETNYERKQNIIIYWLIFSKMYLLGSKSSYLPGTLPTFSQMIHTIMHIIINMHNTQACKKCMH